MRWGPEHGRPAAAPARGGEDRLRILLHDYSGHPFQFQLSEELSRRGHEVAHLYSAQFPTPKAVPGRSVGFAVEALSLPFPLHKYDPARRALYERRYGRLVGCRIAELAPDVVISSNAQLDAQQGIISACRRAAIPFVYWLQDLYSIGIAAHLRRSMPGFGQLVAYRYERLERALLRASEQVVAISDDFLRTCRDWGVAPDRCRHIPNWAPLDEIRPVPRNNAWAREHGLVGLDVVLYAGTLGLKHEPSLLVGLARDLAGDRRTRIVVVSEGLGAARIAEAQRKLGLENLTLLPFQPYERLSEVLGGADVLLTLLNKEAGRFSVPSKLLSCLSAGRPVLFAGPAENLAARTLLAAQAGDLVEPDDAEGLVRAARRLLEDPAERERLGRNARAYAEANFAIGPIATRFEALLFEVTREGRRAAPRILRAPLHRPAA